MYNNLYKKFIVYKLENKEEVGVWESQTQCAKDLNIQRRPISHCLYGQQESYMGYIFKFINDTDDNNDK